MAHPFQDNIVKEWATELINISRKDRTHGLIVDGDVEKSSWFGFGRCAVGRYNIAGHVTGSATVGRDPRSLWGQNYERNFD